MSAYSRSNPTRRKKPVLIDPTLIGRFELAATAMGYTVDHLLHKTLREFMQITGEDRIAKAAGTQPETMPEPVHVCLDSYMPDRGKLLAMAARPLTSA